MSLPQPQNRYLFAIEQTDINEITNKLYVGDQLCSKNKTLLKSLGIKAIVVAGEELTLNFPQDFEYLHIKVKDSYHVKIEEHFNEVYEFIEKNLSKGFGVLVHCRFGVSRSCTLTIAYLIKKLKIKYQEAFNFVRKKRLVAKPNCGFQQQLKNWEFALQLPKQ